MILADKAIKREILTKNLVIEPFHLDRLQPASYDLTLGKEFIQISQVDSNDYTNFIDLRTKYNLTREYLPGEIPFPGFKVNISDEEIAVVYPGALLLGTTIERVELPDNICARFEGKSSLGRIGLSTHVTAGFIDPGFKGNITVEMFVVHNIPIKIYAGMKIGQISFHYLNEKCERPYGHKELGSHYQGQIGVTPGVPLVSSGKNS